MTQSLIQPTLFHRPHAEGRSYWGPGDLYTFLVTGEESGGAYFSMLAVVPPLGGPAAAHPPRRGRDLLRPGGHADLPPRRRADRGGARATS